MRRTSASRELPSVVCVCLAAAAAAACHGRFEPCFGSVGAGLRVGAGTVLMAGVVVNSDSRIGAHCILNTRASLDHDCIMDDFSSLAPGVTVGGVARIGMYSAVSLGANIIHGKNIGAHTVVGAGALVQKDIPDHCVAYGVPARVVRPRAEGERYL